MLFYISIHICFWYCWLFVRWRCPSQVGKLRYYFPRVDYRSNLCRSRCIGRIFIEYYVSVHANHNRKTASNIAMHIILLNTTSITIHRFESRVDTKATIESSIEYFVRFVNFYRCFECLKRPLFSSGTIS